MMLVRRVATAATFLLCIQASLAQTFLIDRRVTVQPIQIASTAGDDRANSTLQLFEAAADKIFAQAGIDIRFLTPVTYSNSVFLNIASDAAQANSLLNLTQTAGNKASTDPNVINLWFAKTINGSSSVYGFSLQTTISFGNDLIRNGVAISDTVFAANAGAGALDVISHELGHNLGLAHSDFGASGNQNLMSSSTLLPAQLSDIFPDGGDYSQLNAQQITRIRSLPYAAALPVNQQYVYSSVPEPATIATATGACLLALVGLRRRRQAQ